MPYTLPPVDKPRDHLVIPDDHAVPGDNFRRYEWLGKYIVDHMPEVIVYLGDSFDMPSLCSYDKGKKDYVFKNIKEDILAGHKALEVTFSPMIEYNKQMAKWKKKQYNPIIVRIRGNHEARLARLLEYDSKLEGMLDMTIFRNRLGLKEYEVPFNDFINVDGVLYAHYFVSGTMGRPVSSARILLAKRAMSCTMGHTHIFDSASLVRPTGEVLRGLIAGSFHDPDYASFAGPQVDNIWWNGIIHKRRVANGSYDMEEISIERLKEMYEDV